jgi:hypothetical protein
MTYATQTAQHLAHKEPSNNYTAESHYVNPKWPKFTKVTLHAICFMVYFIPFNWVSLINPRSSRSVFLKMGSVKGRQGFRETKMRNGGRVLLAVQLRTSVNKISALIMSCCVCVCVLFFIILLNKHVVYHFNFLNSIIILIFYFLKRR